MKRSQTITKEVADALRVLSPGQVEIWTLEDGSEFAVMHRDDFDHVAGLAGLYTKLAKEEA